MSPAYFMDLCRLCLVKDKVSIPIFEGEGEVRNIFMKIVTCLPVKVDKDDKLPKKICDVCLYNVENVFKFWHTTASSEKKLLQWLEESDKNTVCNPPLQTEEVILKEEYLDEQGLENEGIEGSDNSPDDVEQSDDSNSDDEVNSEEDIVEDSVKTAQKEEAESDEDGFEELEPTTFVNVSLACEEQEQAGPSGLQVSSENTENQISAIESSIGLQPQVSQVVLQPIQSLEMQPIHSAQQVQEDAVPSTSNEASGSSGSVNRNITVTPGSSTKEDLSKSLIEEEPTKDSKSNRCESNIKASFNEHAALESESKDLFKCDVCGKNFAKKAFLLSHRSVHKTEDVSCDVCGFKTDSKTVRTHMLTHDTERPFKCNICDKTFKRSKTHKSHLKIHESENKFECDLCNFKTTWKSSLNNHVKSHNQDLPFNCEICLKRFPQKGYLTAHMKKHNGEFGCKICGKVYSSKYSLIEHHNSRHDSKKPFSCKLCGKSFPYKSSLRVHARTHIGEADVKCQLYLCDVCGKKLKSNESLRVHKVGHSGEKPEMCAVCGRAFSNRAILRAHSRTHSGIKPHSCEICAKTFGTLNQLRIHERTHTGERPYACEQCDKTFTQRSTLVIHSRYHTGERPYKCDLCSKAFVSKSLLKKHHKSHKT